MTNNEIYVHKAKGFREQSRIEFGKCKSIKDRTHKQYIRAARLNRLAINYQDLAMNSSLPTNLRIACGNRRRKKG